MERQCALVAVDAVAGARHFTTCQRKGCYRSVCPEDHHASPRCVLPERVVAAVEEFLEAGTDATTIGASTGS